MPSGNVDGAAPREALVAGVTVQHGDQIFRSSPEAILDGGLGTCELQAGPGGPAYAIYRFSGLTADDLPYVFGVELGGSLPGSYWLGYGDYSSGAWIWQPVKVPQAQQQLGVAGTAQARSPAGNAYFAVVADTDEALVINRVTLEVDALCPPPQSPVASQGTAADRISLSWEALDLQHPSLSFDAIQIERALQGGGPYTLLAEVSADTISYDDIHDGGGAGQNDMGDEAPLFYRLRLKRLGAVSAPSFAVSGYREMINVPGFVATNGNFSGLSDRVTLTWDPVPGAQYYAIEYRSNDGGNPAAFTELVTLGPQLSYDHLPGSPAGKGCDSYGAYRYRIRASGLGLASPVWREASGSRKLDVPVLLPSQGTDADGLMLNWGAVPGASGYRIYHSANADLLADLPDNAPYLHEVEDFDLHDYIMQAYCNSNDGEFGGWTSGYRKGWNRHAPASGNGLASSMVLTASGQPLVAARDGNAVVLYLANSVAPDSSDDWTVYSWNGPPNMNPQLALMNGKPVMFNSYFLGDMSQLWYEQANIPLPDSPDDWVGYMLIELSGNINGSMSPLVIGSRPMLATQANDSLVVCSSAVDEPLSPGDWVSYSLESGLSSIDNSKPVLFDLGGKPALVYKNGSSVRYGRSAVTVPTQDTDWTVHDVFDSNSFDAFGTLSGFDAIDAGGYPAFAFSSIASSELRLARATVQEPAGSGHWTYSYVGNRAVPYVQHEVALAQVGSGLRILWAPAPSLYESMPVCSFSTPSLAPDSQNAWSRKIVDYGVGPVDLVNNGGSAAAIYSSEDASFAHTVMYAGEL